MYGMVNRAIQELVTRDFGTDAWRSIAAAADFSEETFVAMQPYPDDLTYRLVEAASHHTGLSATQLLEAFGEFWILYTAKQGYGDVLHMFGTTLSECLQNLDQMHAKISLSFPDLAPPSFPSDRQTGGSALGLLVEQRRMGDRGIGALRVHPRLRRTPLQALEETTHPGH